MQKRKRGRGDAAPCPAWPYLAERVHGCSFLPQSQGRAGHFPSSARPGPGSRGELPGGLADIYSNISSASCLPLSDLSSKLPPGSDKTWLAAGALSPVEYATRVQPGLILAELDGNQFLANLAACAGVYAEVLRPGRISSFCASVAAIGETITVRPSRTSA